MSEDLLLELKAAAPIVADLEGLEKQEPVLEQLWRLFLDQVGAAVEGMKGSSLAFENVWRRAVLDVAGGRTAEVQTARPALLAALEKRLDRLRRTHAFAGRLRRSHGAEAAPDPDVLLPEIAALERLKSRVFDRWQTEVDLERLAIEDYPLSQVQLRQVSGDARTPSRVVRGRGGTVVAREGDPRVRLAAGSDRPRGSA